MSRLSDVEEQIPLSDQFSNPLSLVPDADLSSAGDVQSLFLDLATKLEQNDDWQLKASAIQDAMSYLKSGIQQRGDANFSVLAPGIASSVTNLRSALVRWGSLYVAAAAQSLQNGFVNSIEIVVPALFKQLSHGTAIIANSCHYALLEVAKNVMHRRTSRVFMAKLKSKSNQQRQVVAEFIQIAIESWPQSLVSSLFQTFQDALKALVEDPAPSVRQIAREATDALGGERPSSRQNASNRLSIKIPVTPSTPRARISHIPTSPNTKARTPSYKRRSVDDPSDKPPRSPRGSSKGPMTQPVKKSNILLDLSDDNLHGRLNDGSQSPSPKNSLKFSKIPPPIDTKPDKDIDEYMPPKTNKDSEHFLALLTEITTIKDYSRLDGLDVLLPSSILYAVKFIPDIERWKISLSALFEQFPEAFDDQICDILDAFKYNQWLVKQFAMYFDPKATVDREVQNNNNLRTIQFIAALFKNDIVVNMDPKIKKKLLKMISNFSDDESSIYLKNRLNGKTTKSVNEHITIPTRIAKISKTLEESDNIEDTTVQLDELAEIFIKSKEDLSSEIEPLLLNTFENGTHEQIIVLLEFCLKVIKAKSSSNSSKKVYFESIYPNLKELLSETDRTIIELSTSIIVKMAEIDNNLVIKLMEEVDEAINQSMDESIITNLMIIHAFFVDLPEQNIYDFSDSVMKYLQPALGSNNTSVRRLVVLIYVEFRYKIPQKFHSYMESLSMTQQKLIELYSSKRGSKK